MVVKNVLVVDDDSMVLESIRITLRYYGHSVETASSGAEALMKLAAGEFAVVVTDLRMEGMQGDELASQIKSRWPRLPVILLTGFAPEQKPQAVDVILVKPFSTTDLSSTIRTVAGQLGECLPG